MQFIERYIENYIIGQEKNLKPHEDQIESL